MKQFQKFKFLMDDFFGFGKDVRRLILTKFLSIEDRFIFFHAYNFYKNDVISIPKRVRLLAHCENNYYYELLEWVFANYIGANQLTLLGRTYNNNIKYYNWILAKYNVKLTYNSHNKLPHYFLFQSKLSIYDVVDINTCDIIEYYKSHKIELTDLCSILDYLSPILPYSPERIELIKYKLFLYVLSSASPVYTYETSKLLTTIISLIKRPSNFYEMFLNHISEYKVQDKDKNKDQNKNQNKTTRFIEVIFESRFVDTYYKFLRKTISNNFASILNRTLRTYEPNTFLLKYIDDIFREPLDANLINQAKQANSFFIQNNELNYLKLMPKYYDKINLVIVARKDLRMFEYLVDNGAKCDEETFAQILHDFYACWKSIFYVLKRGYFVIDKNNQEQLQKYRQKLTQFCIDFGSVEFIECLEELGLLAINEEHCKYVCIHNPKLIGWIKQKYPNFVPLLDNYIDQITKPNELLTIMATEYKYERIKKSKLSDLLATGKSIHNANYKKFHPCLMSKVYEKLGSEKRCHNLYVKINKVICNDCAKSLKPIKINPT